MNTWLSGEYMAMTVVDDAPCACDSRAQANSRVSSGPLTVCNRRCEVTVPESRSDGSWVEFPVYQRIALEQAPSGDYPPGAALEVDRGPHVRETILLDYCRPVGTYERAPADTPSTAALYPAAMLDLDTVPCALEVIRYGVSPSCRAPESGTASRCAWSKGGEGGFSPRVDEAFLYRSKSADFGLI
jgi:hypothetical protein